MKNDLPEWIKNDIISGKFDIELQAYTKAREHFLKYGYAPGYSVFYDAGQYTQDLPLKKKVNLYRDALVLSQQKK